MKSYIILLIIVVSIATSLNLETTVGPFWLP